MTGQFIVRSKLDPRHWIEQIVFLRPHALVFYKEDISREQILHVVPLDDIVHVVPFHMLEAAPFDMDDHPLGIECTTRDHAVHHWLVAFAPAESI